MDLQVALLTVYRDKKFRLAKCMNDLQFFLAGVTGNMQTLALFIDYLSALAVQFVNDTGHCFLIAGDSRGGNDDPVAGLDIHLLVGGKCHAVQRRHIFALRTGGNNDHLVFGKALNGSQVHNSACRYFDITQLLGDLQHVFHAATGDGDFSAIAVGSGKNCLDAVHIGCKCGDDDSLVAVFELTVQTFGNDVFTGGVALTLHIGGITQQCKHTLVTQFTQTGKIDHAIFCGGVDLKVAGHDDGAYRGVDGKCHCVGDRMVHMNKFHSEAACFDHITGFVCDQLDLISNAVLFQL